MSKIRLHSLTLHTSFLKGLPDNLSEKKNYIVEILKRLFFARGQLNILWTLGGDQKLDEEELNLSTGTVLNIYIYI